jgi:hypothetical protein
LKVDEVIAFTHKKKETNLIPLWCALLPGVEVQRRWGLTSNGWVGAGVQGAASVKGMVMMETIYPSKDGATIFEDPKLKQRLVKEMKKGNIKPPSMSDSLGALAPPHLCRPRDPHQTN